MNVLGAYARIKDRGYVAGFAFVEDERLGQTHSYTAPADRDEPGQLDDLLGICTDLIAELHPDAIAIRAYEHQQKMALRLAHHAEGVVMAAAGATDLPVHRFVTQSLWKPAGFERQAKAAELQAEVRFARQLWKGINLIGPTQRSDGSPPRPDGCQDATTSRNVS